MRQQLGTISHDEVEEVNRVLGKDGIRFKKGSEPAQLLALNNRFFYIMLFGGFTFAGIGLIFHKTNLLWLGAAPIPALIYGQANKNR